jgi:hypothetical protein
MGFGIGIGMGWPMASSSRNKIYTFEIKDCIGSLRTVFSVSSNFLPGAYMFRDPELTIPYTNGSQWNLPELINSIGGYQFNEQGEIQPGLFACPGGLVRYQIIQGCNQAIPSGAATQLVNSNLYTYGDYVYSPSFDTRVTLGSIIESFEVEYQIQGPAFSGCE